MSNEATMMNPAMSPTGDGHTPYNCPLGEKVEETQEHLYETLRSINDSLAEGRATMGTHSKALEKITDNVGKTNDRVTGIVWLFRGLSMAIGAAIVVFLWILLERNGEFKDVVKIVNATQNEMMQDRIRRESEILRLSKEVEARARSDAETFQTMRRTLELLSERRR